MNRGIVVNGRRIEWVRILQLDVGRIAPIRRKNREIPGRPGALSQGYETGVRQIQARLDFEATSMEEWQEKLAELMGLLIQEKPYEIKFENEDKWTYYAELDGEIETVEIGIYGQVVINWICTDPYKYGHQNILPFKQYEENGEPLGEASANIINSGTVPTFPRITATVKPGEKLTHIQVFDPFNEKYFQIGRPGAIGTITRDKEERLLNDPASSLVGWSTTGGEVDGGVVSGNMATNGFSFLPGSFGATVDGWHGPILRKEAPEAPITDFKIRLGVIMRNPSISARGRLELYMRDAQGDVIGKIAMKRTGGGAYGNSVEGRAGGENDFDYFVSNYAGSKGIEWRDFEGVMEIERINNVWAMYVALVDPQTGKHTARYRSQPWTDSQLKYTGGLSQIMLHMAQSGDTEPVTVFVTKVEIFRINEITEMEIPVMALEGDEIEMDFRTKEIRINGEPRKDLKAFGANFFSLNPGTHDLMIEPFEKLDNPEVTVREGYR